MGLVFGATDNRMLLASKWQAGCLSSLGATDKLVCPCGAIASDRMLARPRKTFEFNRAFPWPNSRTPSNLFVRVIDTWGIENSPSQENPVIQRDFLRLDFPDGFRMIVQSDSDQGDSGEHDRKQQVEWVGLISDKTVAQDAFSRVNREKQMRCGGNLMSDLSPDEDRSLHRLQRARHFRQNLSALLDRHEISILDLCQSSDLDRKVVQRWVRRGAERISTENLAKLARAFGIDPPSRLFDANLLAGTASISIHPLDRDTNPAVVELARSRPELFEKFTPAEWKELYSLRGTGGELTPEGVERAARKIDSKRRVRRQFEALLETHHFAMLETLIDTLYRDTEVPRGLIPKEPPASGAV
jgi:transcriptional regulator with XRE-family HTH domain